MVVSVPGVLELGTQMLYIFGCRSDVHDTFHVLHAFARVVVYPFEQIHFFLEEVGLGVGDTKQW